MAGYSMKAEDDDDELFFPFSGSPSTRADRSTSTQAGSATKNQNPASSSGAHPKWKQPFERPGQRVIHKEKAAESGLQCLKHMITILRSYHEPSLTRICQLWEERIEAILNDVEQHPILIGLIGGTGAGKSTLINAILKMRGLLPAHPSRACTAAVVEVAYNRSDDADAAYRAEIKFISANEWRAELQVVFRDIEAHNLDSAIEDGEEDLDRLKRIQDALATLKVVYPTLTSVDDLLSTSIQELMDGEHVGDVLDSTEVIQHAKQSSFSNAIRPYIATSEADKLANWPLIKCVKVFVKAPILEHGIVLVDLPGNMDRNSARGAIAMDYLKNLAAPLIVADAKRGIDDRNAHLILEDVMKTDLKMDGIYSSGSLCFILSQFDRDFDCPDYWSQIPELQMALKPLRKKDMEIKAIIREREKELSEIQTSQENHEFKIEEIQNQLSAGETTATKSTKTNTRSGLKRKRGTGNDTADSPAPPTLTITQLRRKLTSLKQISRNESIKIDTLNKGIANLKSALRSTQSQIIHACNKDRKDKASAAVRKDFENNLHEMGKTGAKNTLQVFCTSSVTYLNYVCANPSTKKAMGFPDVQTTEIPQLRDWLVEFTFPSREQKAQLLLESIERLMGSMRPWIDDRSGDLKMTAMQRREREPEFESLVKGLERKLSELRLKTTKSMEQLVVAGIYSKLTEVERVAAKSSVKTVVAWGTELKWNTHKAINQRRGEWVEEKKQKSHIWNAQLAKEYKHKLVNSWTRVFHEKFSEVMANYVADGMQLIVEFALSTAKVECFPEFAIALELLKEQFIKTSNLLRVQRQKIEAEIQKKLKDVHRHAPPAIKTFLEPMYSQCASEGGDGHYKRNKETHRAQMANHGVEMYRKVSQTLQVSVGGLLKEIPELIRAGATEVIDQIVHEIVVFFEHNSTSGTRTSPKKYISPTKVKLQDTLKTAFENLLKAWCEDIKFEVDEMVDLTGLDFEGGDRYNVDSCLHGELDDSSDDDYRA